MILALYLGLIILACLLTLLRWRKGPFCLMAIGFLADPVRKLMPGAPAWMVMACIPVWMCMVASAIASNDLNWNRFRARLPSLHTAVAVFIITWVPGIILSISYSTDSWKVALMGTFSYAAIILGALAGYQFPASTTLLWSIPVAYCLVAAPLMTGTILEHLGVNWVIVSSKAIGDIWVTYRADDPVYMLSGFFRSPDIMGWHAATLTTLSATLAMYTRGSKRGLWLLSAAWGLTSVILCGRRKMLAIVLVFAGLLLLLLFRGRRKWRFWAALLSLLLVGFGGTQLYRFSGADAALNRFQSSLLEDASPRLVAHGFDTTIETYRQTGFFGVGIGMANQGVRHITAQRPRTWQEGGLSKLMAEFGVPGTLAFVVLLLVYAVNSLRGLKRIEGLREHILYAGLIAFVGANAIAAIVSAHVFADFFILLLISFLAGLVLSAHRLRPDTKPS